MNKTIIITLLNAIILCAYSTQAQVSIGRQVISCQSASYTSASAIYLSDTSGQPEYLSQSGSTAVLSQGFQQGDALEPLEIVLNIEQPSCSNEKLGSISLASFSGCATMNTFIYLLNGNPVDLPLTALPPGSYTLEIYAFVGCTANVSFVLNEAPSECSLVFPNVFTPDGDNINPIWFIQNISLPEFAINNVSIFSRWGNEVWKGKNYDNTSVFFNGLDMKNKELPSGTYFYKVETGEQSFTGYIEILR